MFSFASISLALVLALQAHGHAIITPDISGGTTRADVKRPTNAAPCGQGVDIASLIDTAQAVPVTNGAVQATITNFNLGLDGSRAVKAQIDPTGTGNNFEDATVTTNGDKFSLDFSSQPLAVQVPAGMAASGGANGNAMLVSFKNAFGFGNCIVATMDAAASNTTAAAAATGSTATGTGTGTTETGTGTTTNTDDLKQAVGAAPIAGVGSGAARAGAQAKAAKAKAGAGAQAPAAKAQRTKRSLKARVRNAISLAH